MRFPKLAGRYVGRPAGQSSATSEINLRLETDGRFDWVRYDDLVAAAAGGRWWVEQQPDDRPNGGRYEVLLEVTAGFAADLQIVGPTRFDVIGAEDRIVLRRQANSEPLELRCKGAEGDVK
ncbi:hypothetical protein [Mycolicibacterium grossiae]|uniref:hypothetical protein n=1 Tax=Mycolicibacterium grossiae TaxID=1552759 RepID=UPI000F7841F7|nr:hypothetical protein [Mycolicibacterium grossiae]QEM43566.1 hypothetical protein FZ046_01145 [Mycolicibacterium grossiae]